MERVMLTDKRTEDVERTKQDERTRKSAAHTQTEDATTRDHQRTRKVHRNETKFARSFWCVFLCARSFVCTSIFMHMHAALVSCSKTKPRPRAGASP